MMKKQIILILFLLGNLTTSFSQQTKKTAFDNLVGTYQGITLTAEGIDGANKVTAELTADFNLKITENFDGLFVEHINEKVVPQAGGEMKNGIYVFEFKAVSKESEFSVIRIMIHNEAILPNTNLSMSIAFKKHTEEEGIFAVTKEGGSLKKPTVSINFSDIHNFVFYSGKTADNTFGDFKIEWYPSHQFGYLRYKHVTNVFKITNTGRKYFLHHNSTDDIELEYIFNSNKSMKLKEVHKGYSLFDNSKIKQNKNIKTVNNQEEFLLEIGNSFYNMMHDKFKAKGDYTLTHQNKLNGKGINFILSEDKPLVYMGGFKDGIYHGEGSSTTIEASEKGSYKKGIRHGHFYLSSLEGDRASGEYKDGVQDGLWKVQKANGATFDMVFQNGKKISTTETNKGVKNTQIAKHVKDAEYQLKGTRRLFNELGDIASRCNDRTTLRSYQSCYRTLKPKIDAFSVGIVAGIRELEKAKKEAKNSKCERTFLTLKNAESDLWKANGALGDAYKAATELYHATTVSKAKSENSKCYDALNKTVDAMNDYKVWIGSLGLNECYTYSTTDSSTLPSKNTTQSQSTTRNKTYPQRNTSSSSSSSSQNTTATKTKTVTSSPVVYPPFTGKYEGDNLLLLMGRKIGDPAVQGLLKNSYFDFEESFNGVSKVQKKYSCNKYRFSIKFENGILTQMSFKYLSFDKSGYFKKRMPLGIPMAKPLSKMKNMKDNWKLFEYGSARDYSISKYQLSFEAKGDVNDGGVVSIVNINATDVKDWNSYYQQFK